MIRIEDLRVVFNEGTPDENIALRNISLSVQPGDFITVIGSNGAGKSTLLNAIAGTVAPRSGKIFLYDNRNNNHNDEHGNNRNRAAPGERDITRIPEYCRARYIGRIFQNPLLGTAGRMSLEDNMMLCFKKGYKGLRISLTNERRDQFRALLARLEMGLEDRLSDNVELLSGGQRQALTLLMTVISSPSLLLLDEHTAALDPRNAEIVMNQTLRFAGEYGLTVIMITHNMAHALKYGNRLLMMDAGEIILDIGNEEKARLTTAGIVQRFRDIKKNDLANDELLLS
ncbi:MAG: ATP-binding cassette domain-containing protein [Spirochaetaceae bacterium]|jgi:putative ABC transport system ATP-binding protein|nr:ATP-binding cassette domain-containing protein [Spirochaetaceae bacterium]